MTKAERFSQLTCTQKVRADLRTKSVRAAAFTWISGASDFALRIGSTAVLARLILPEHFGLVMMVTAVTAIADQLKELGLSAATVQKSEITHQEVTNLFWVNMLAGGVIALAVCCVSPLISVYYREPRLTVITCVLATNFVWGSLMVQHQALLTRQLKLGYTSGVRLGSSLISTLLAIVLAWLDFGYWALVWREVARSVLLAAGMWFCFPWIPGLPSRKTDIRGLIGFGMNLTGANIIGSITGGMDRFLIGRFCGAGPVAVYRQAYQLMVAPIDQLLSPVYQVAQPGLSMLQTDPTRFRRLYHKVLTIVCLGTMPLSLFVAVYSRELTLILLGRKWVESAPVLLVLSFGAFFKQVVGSAAIVLIALGRSKTYLKLALLHNLTMALLMLIGVRWGIVGVAVADVATTYLMVAPKLYFIFKDSPFSVRLFFSSISRPAAASIVMALVLLLFRWAFPQANILVAVGLGGVLALPLFIGAFVVVPGGKPELAALVSDLRSALQRKTAAMPKAEPVSAAVTS